MVSGPVIAVGLVLSAVFVPAAFITGITGLFFRQFALTIAVSTLISAFNSLTLSPALSALLLKPHKPGERTDPLPRLAFVLIAALLGYFYVGPWLAGFLPGSRWMPLALSVVAAGVLGWFAGRPLNRLLGAAFRAFNAGFDRSTGWYISAVGVLLRV